ncbi:MAG: hypothetical protein WCP70_06440 [Methanothrix sp.]
MACWRGVELADIRARLRERRVAARGEGRARQRSGRVVESQEHLLGQLYLQLDLSGPLESPI